MNRYHCAVCNMPIHGLARTISHKDMSHCAFICLTCSARMESSTEYRMEIQESLRQEYSRLVIEKIAEELGIAEGKLKTALLLGAAGAKDEQEAGAATERLLGLTSGRLEVAISAALQKSW